MHPQCGWLDMLSHTEAVWERFFAFSAVWAARSRPGKHPLWKSGLELCANYTLSCSSNEVTVFHFCSLMLRKIVFPNVIM